MRLSLYLSRNITHTHSVSLSVCLSVSLSPSLSHSLGLEASAWSWLTATSSNGKVVSIKTDKEGDISNAETKEDEGLRPPSSLSNSLSPQTMGTVSLTGGAAGSLALSLFGSITVDNDEVSARTAADQESAAAAHVKRLNDRAVALYRALSDTEGESDGEGSALVRQYRRSAVSQARETLRKGLSPVLCYRDAEASREDAVLQRAVLVAVTLAGTSADGERVKSCFIEQDRGLDERERECWGPMLVVCRYRDLDAWEAALTAVVSEASLDLQVVPYYGSDGDRMTMRSYFRAALSSTAVGLGATAGVGGGLGALGTGLYADRSHCHIILACYETLLLDAHYFRDILWTHCVYDEPWSMLSHTRYAFAARQCLALVKTRQRILSCSEIAKSVTADDLTPDIAAAVGLTLSSTTVEKEVDGERPMTPAKEGEKDSAVVVPDAASVLFTLCPAALGQSGNVSEAPATDNITEAVAYSLAQAELPLSPAAITLRSEAAPGQTLSVPFDKVADCVALRLLGALTVMCDVDLVSLSLSLPNKGRNKKSPETMLEELTSASRVVAALEWQGLQRTYGERESDGVDAVRLHHSGTPSRSISLLGALRFEAKSDLRPEQWHLLSRHYPDLDLDVELRHLNLAVVGRTGTTMQRLRMVEGPVSGGALSAQELMRRTLDTRGGGRGRGRGRGRKARGSDGVAPATEGNPEAAPADTTTAPSSEGAADAPIGGTVEGEGPGTVVPTGGRGRGRGGRGRGRGRGAAAAANVPTEIMAGESTSVPSDSAIMEIAAGIAAEAVGVTAGRPKGRKSKGKGSAEGEIDLDALVPPPPSLSVEEEMVRYVTQRANVWYACIIVSARQRFLGAFREESEAQAVFRQAYAQREEQRRAMALAKRHMPREMKLTDGSFITGDYYRSLDDGAVCEEVRAMVQPLHLAGYSLTHWGTTTHHAPPSYALLRGTESFAVAVDDVEAVLGRSVWGESEGTLARIGVDRESLDKGFSSGSGPIRRVHLSADLSVARRHALLRWIGEAQAFHIRAISTSGLFIDGRKVMPGDGFVPLRHKCVLQVGGRSFFFLLPVQDPQYAGDEPLSFRRDVARTEVDNLRLRALLNSNMGLSADELERLIPAAMQTVEQSETKTMLRLADPPTAPAPRVRNRKPVTAKANGGPVDLSMITPMKAVPSEQDVSSSL